MDSQEKEWRESIVGIYLRSQPRQTEESRPGAGRHATAHTQTSGRTQEPQCSRNQSTAGTVEQQIQVKLNLIY